VSVTDLTGRQLEDIRRRVRTSIESIAAGQYTEYEGPEGYGCWRGGEGKRAPAIRPQNLRRVTRYRVSQDEASRLL
jgi:hypothetical protein